MPNDYLRKFSYLNETETHVFVYVCLSRGNATSHSRHGANKMPCSWLNNHDGSAANETMKCYSLSCHWCALKKWKMFSNRGIAEIVFYIQMFLMLFAIAITNSHTQQHDNFQHNVLPATNYTGETCVVFFFFSLFSVVFPFFFPRITRPNEIRSTEFWWKKKKKKRKAKNVRKKASKILLSLMCFVCLCSAQKIYYASNANASTERKPKKMRTYARAAWKRN